MLHGLTQNYPMKSLNRKNRWALLAIVLSMVAILFHACSKASGEGTKALTQPDGHLKMLSILAEVNKKINHPLNGFAAAAKLKYCDSLYAATTDPKTQLELVTMRGAILLELGDEAEAVSMFEQVLSYVKDDPNYSNTTRKLLGMAYLRLAERNNCVNGHSTDACIIPIQGTGIHQDKIPARKAAEAFEAVLASTPGDLDSRWLLNLAYMTLGEYPQGVPAKWLIPNLDEKGKIQVKPFTDLANDLGIQTNNRAGGSIVEDFNNDGYLDIVTSAWGLDDPMHYFANNADGTFSDVSKASGLSDVMGGLNLLQTDYNNDGNMDIFVLRGAWQGVGGCGEQPNSLLRNNGNGTFTDVTIDAGLLAYRPTQTATWNDFNKDGWLDLFIGNETTSTDKPYPCEFYINNQDGTFTNIANTDNFNITLFVKGVTSGDYNNDGWPDIFLSCQSGQRMLLRNAGIQGKVPQFEDVSEKAGFTSIKASTFPTFFFDYDNDGWLDIFACNYEFNRPLSFYAAKEALHPSADKAGKIYLFHNNQDGSFTDVSPKMNLNQAVFAMGSNFGDIDNDGWLDMYLATGNPNFESLVPNRMYKNLAGRDFAEVTASARVGNLQKGHGVSFADLNNNGDQDIHVDMGGAYLGDAYYSSFYLNPGQNDNSWICIKLEGNHSNRAAIGARLRLTFHENGKEREVYRDVNSGGSFGASPLRREIGVGQTALIDEIAIFWPATGMTQVIKNVEPNQFIHIVEGQEGYQTMELKSLVFKRRDGTIPMCAPRSVKT